MPNTTLNRTHWRDKDSVIELCRRLGAGNCVIKYTSRTNYNIVRYPRAVEVVDHRRVLMIYVCTSANEIRPANAA